MNDSDRIAWMDGLPVGFYTEYEQDGASVTVERVPDGWKVGHIYTDTTFRTTVATWREVIDRLNCPPTPRPPIEHGSLLDWEESARG